MLTVVLTRHGSTPRSDPEQHLGQRLDLPLSKKGRRAAERLGRRLASVEFERVISSPLRRAVETAELVVPGGHGEIEPRLTEMDYGAWEGLTYAEIEARDAEARRLWEADPASLACPGGESGNDVAARVRAFLEAAIEAAGDPADPTEHRILTVAHSSTNRILLCVALGVAIRDFRRRFTQHPANLTVLRFGVSLGSGGLALLVNDVAHDRGVSGPTWD